MQKSFTKDSLEREMVVALWDMFQKFWIPELKDIYWKELIAAVDEFTAKFQGIPGNLATKIAVDFIEAKEAELREASDD
jgi:hypothetical protein